jgi:hypothetical protein
LSLTGIKYNHEHNHAYRIIVGKTKGKIPHEIHLCKEEDNIKMDFKELGFVDAD